MSETVLCPFCKSEIPVSASKCRHCGEWVSRDCLKCGTPIRNEWAARGLCAECEVGAPKEFPVRTSAAAGQVPVYGWGMKSRTASVALALVLGGFGAHKFYLDKPGKGFLYLLFSWTGIPSLIGLYEAVKYIRMSEEEFHRKALHGLL